MSERNFVQQTLLDFFYGRMTDVLGILYHRRSSVRRKIRLECPHVDAAVTNQGFKIAMREGRPRTAIGGSKKLSELSSAASSMSICPSWHQLRVRVEWHHIRQNAAHLRHGVCCANDA